MSCFDCLHIKIHFGISSRLIRWQLQKPYFCKQVELQTEFPTGKTRNQKKSFSEADMVMNLDSRERQTTSTL